MQLRSYQSEAIQSIWNYFQSGNSGNPVLALPTGTGKSVIIAGFIKSVFEKFPNQRIMMLTHVKELIAQNFSKLKQLWPQAPAGIYSAGLKQKEVNAPITFAGIGSVAKKPAVFGHIDLVIIDEVHMVSPSDNTMYQKFLGGLREINPYVKVIGLTATPWRLGHGKITDPITHKDGSESPSLFTDICFDITGSQSFNRLIAEGFLAPLIPRATNTKLDVNGVHMRGGEFIQKELQNAVDKMDITVAAVKEAREEGHDRESWLVFCAGVEHSINTAEIMNDLGIPTVAIHSKMTDAERDQAILDFKAGKYRAVTNNNVLTTGFDHPKIDLILCLRPTASAVLWVQMLGRGTRPSPGKENCLVLDFASNTKRLGPINDPVTPRRKGAKGGGGAPVKECPKCHTYQHASVRICNGVDRDGNPCGHEFKFETKLKQAASSQELIKGDLPVVEIFEVDHVSFSKHQKVGKPPMLRVSYYCGLRVFEEFVFIENPTYAGKKARDWWRAHGGAIIPTTVDEALDNVDNLTIPTHLRVWVNKKYPEIMAVCYDGTAFGTQDDRGKRPINNSKAKAKSEPLEIEGIPF